MNETSELDFRESLPPASEYLALFESTGWNREYRLSAEDLQEAIRHSWFLVTAYDQNRLVGTGRVISDGVFHALIVDVIVKPAYQRRSLGTAIMRRLLERCRAARIRDVQLFCARGKISFYSRLGFIARSEEAPGMDFRPAPPTAIHGE
jgi:GNAT superfamily N-acetyltransferase